MALCARKLCCGWIGLILASALAPGAWGQAPPVDVEVRVTELLHHEQPVEYALIELLHFPGGLLWTTHSDSSGRAKFSNLKPDSYIVRASKQGFQSQEVRVEARRGDRFYQVSIQLQSDEPERTQTPAGTVSSRSLAIPPSALSELQKGTEFLNGKKDPGASISHFQRAIEAFPNYYEAYFLKGMAYLQLNALDEARVALGKAIELEPKNLAPYHPLAVVLFSSKHYDEAEALLAKASKMDPAGWRWPFELARCYAAQGQWEKALQYGQMAHEQPDAPPKVHLLMSDIYSNIGDNTKALEELAKFSRLDPQSPFMPRVREKMNQLRKNPS